MNGNRKFVLAMVAALGLGGCGEERHPMLSGGREVKSWVEDLRSPDARVRRQAVLKLGNVGDADPAVADALAGALRDSDPLVRHDAVMAVVKLKSPGEPIVAALRDLAKNDQDDRVRESAAKALKKLGHEN
jgi:HEAT repeat protein